MSKFIREYEMLHNCPELISCCGFSDALTTGRPFGDTDAQTWNLSKILHCLIFRLKILHRQFHLILTVLVRKKQKMSENGEIYTAGKNFTLPPALTAWTNSTSELMLNS